MQILLYLGLDFEYFVLIIVPLKNFVSYKFNY